jgi:hypothetical protein
VQFRLVGRRQCRKCGRRWLSGVEELFDVREGARPRSAHPWIAATAVTTSLSTTHSSNMSDKSKGISLRKKRDKDKKKNGAPATSAPRQISAPMPAGAALSIAPSISSSNRPSTESSRSRQNRGPTRRRTWSSGGTRRRSRRCPATLAAGPCRTCPRSPASIGARASRGKCGRRRAAGKDGAWCPT